MPRTSRRDPARQAAIDLGGKLLGDRIAQRRKALGLTRRQLDQASGVAYDTIASIEWGRRLPSLDTLRKLAAALNTTTVELVTGVYPWDDVPAPN